MTDQPAATSAPKIRDAEKQKILTEARKRYDRAMERERPNIVAAYEDLEFLAGGTAQWDATALKQRQSEGRPWLTVNQLPQFVHQVTGDIRQMKPGIKVVAVDDDADPKLADLRGGMIRYIENRSDASGIYFQAADSQVAAGIGHWRVLTEYADDTTFDQELRIASVDDGVSVLWDPDAKRLTKEDALFCFVPVDYTADTFKANWPDANTAGLDEEKQWTNYPDWVTDDHVRVAEYWVKKPQKIKLALTADGRTINLNDEPDALDILAKMGGEPPRIEERDSYKVCRYLITATDILEGPEEWAGRFIPIVPVIGEEVRIGRKLVRKGIVRDAKDPQRMYNYFRAAQTEVVAMQPKAPFMVTELNVAKYQSLWDTANTANNPFLVFTPDQANGGAAPQRIQPAVSSQGIDEGVAQANEDLRRVIGIYDASLGAKSNETSGKAIMARQREGDTGTYLYIDNFTRAVRHTGKILIDLIPHVYDTQRTIRIMGDDGKIDLMKINQEINDAGQPILDEQGQPAVLNDLSAGSYDVIAEMGPSYATKREEAREGMTALLQAVPEIAPTVMDAYVMAQDWPEKEKLARRVRMMLPPNIMKAEALADQGVPEDQIQQAMMADAEQQPNPEAEAAAADAQSKAQASQLAAQTAELKLREQAANTEAAERKLALQEQTAWFEVQAKVKREDTEAEARINRENALANHKMEVGEVTTIHSIETDRAKTDASLGIERDKHELGSQLALNDDARKEGKTPKKVVLKSDKPDPMAVALEGMGKSLADAIGQMSQGMARVGEGLSHMSVGFDKLAASTDRNTEVLKAPKVLMREGGEIVGSRPQVN